jgi:predicted O-linked N-acetylglucosamine transferase (SPINDLY family)
MLRKLISRLRPAQAAGRAARPEHAARPGAVEQADALIAAGRQAEDAGRLAEACEHYRRAAALAPGHVPAQLNLGIALAASGDAQGAAAAYRAALAIDPGHAAANYNLATLLFARAGAAQAEILLRRALARQPDFPEARVVLSDALDTLGKTEAAAQELAAALALKPDYAGALYNYGIVLRKLERFAEAEDALRRAIALDPWNPGAYEVLSSVLRDQCRVEDALQALRAARALAPDALHLESKELLVLNFLDDFAPEELFARHRDFGARLERAVPARFAHFAADKDVARKLRVGYLSGDFRVHPVALFMIPLLSHHDRDAFEVRCYSTGSKPDHITARLRDLADAWIDCASLSDEALADTIHRDGVDILVDLSGHTGVYRLGVFAQRPAPVQLSWLGYLNTTGLTRIQYRLCDARTDPPGVSDPVHTEKLIRLPHSQWCYRPFIPVEPAAQAPCETNGFVTFGSFNHPSKISPKTLALWSEILRRVPDSRLRFAGVSSDAARDRLRAGVAGAGVAAERIAFAPRVDVDEYYRLYADVDIALDTMPYGGGTTTLDALWMGVPVVAAPGRTPVSRSASSILQALALDAWVAPGPQDYVPLAVERAQEPRVIAELRRTLRRRMLDSPLTDEAGFARHVEDAFRGMWRDWRRECARS